MPRYVADWHCPALCGCVITIDAEWVHEPAGVVADVPQQHAFPKAGGVIASLIERSVCAAHAAFLTDPLPADPYQGRPGYLPIPANPTPAEKLFIRLYQYSGGAQRLDTCGCRVGLVVDRFAGTAIVVPHPQHSRRCVHHADDHDHGRAVQENRLKNDAVAVLAEALNLSAADIGFVFSADRDVLELVPPAAHTIRARAEQARLTARFGAGRVIVT